MLRSLFTFLSLAAATTGQTCVFTGAATFPDPGNGWATFWSESAQAGEFLRYQYLVPAQYFANVPYLIRDFSVPVNRGYQIRRFQRIEVRMAHTSVASISNTFLNNITQPLQTVLDKQEHVMTLGLGPRWVPIGMQQPFQFVPTNGNLLIDILLTGPVVLEDEWFWDNYMRSPSFIGGRRSGPTSNPTVGDSALAPSFRFCLDQAAWSLLGEACEGAVGTAPQLGITGMPELGGSSTFWLHNAPASSLALLAFGFDDPAPYPIDLTAIGAPGCSAFFPLAATVGVPTDTFGVGSHTIAILNTPSLIGQRLFGQYATLAIGQNPLGLLTSQYARLLLGI